MSFETLKWYGGTGGYLELLDQRKLPGSFEKMQCRTVEQLYDAIKTLAVRGAPAIGVAAGYGVCIAMQSVAEKSTLHEAMRHLEKNAGYLCSSRPTAVNLSWAIERMKACARKFITQNPDAPVCLLKQKLLEEAQAICDEDKDMCSRIGVNGLKFIKDGSSILTHCNAGALAAAGRGTALSILYEAHEKGRKITVYVDETRPLLQGARLTMWELLQAGLKTFLICDSAAASLMKAGKIDAVLTGADRIAANGDAANKIGTYGLSILAREHRIPFYIAAPSSTFDLSIKTGAEIPIEQRDAAEVTSFAGAVSAPKGVGVYNPAFDVIDAGDITAIITELGVIEKPDEKKISQHFANHKDKISVVNGGFVR